MRKSFLFLLLWLWLGFYLFTDFANCASRYLLAHKVELVDKTEQTAHPGSNLDLAQDATVSSHLLDATRESGIKSLLLCGILVIYLVKRKPPLKNVPMTADLPQP